MIKLDFSSKLKQTSIRCYTKKESGVTMIEYALIAALIAIIAIIAIFATGNSTAAKFGNISNAIGSTDSGNTPLPDPTPSAPGSTTIYASSYSINGADGTAEYLAITKDQRTLENATIDGTTYSLTQIEAPTDVSAGGACSTTQSANVTAVEIIDKVLPSSMGSWFCNCTKLSTIQGWDNIDSSFAGDMTDTFAGCSSLTAVPTLPSSVTNMTETFGGCSSLTSAPNIPSSVTNIAQTFYGCSSLTVAPNVLPSSVTDMTDTFHGCSSLTAAPAIPSSVTNMTQTFSGCSSLTSAPTIPSSVTDMPSTFYGCVKLLSGPDIPSSVTDMSHTFSGCSSLTGSIKIAAVPTTSPSCFLLAATNSDAHLTVNYALPATSNSIDNLIKTKSANSHIVTGSAVS